MKMSAKDMMILAVAEAIVACRAVAWLRQPGVFRAGKWAICGGFVGVA